MRIKKVEINGEKLRFNKNDNLIFIKENKQYGSNFIESLQKVFRRHLIEIDSVCVPTTNIKCVCEKGGIDFTISVKVQEKNVSKNPNCAGGGGSFEMVGTYKPQNNLSDAQKKLIRIFKLDIQEFFMREETARQIAFYERGMVEDFTDTITFNYKTNLDYASDRSKAEQTEEEKIRNDFYLDKLKTECSAMEKFIKDFKKIKWSSYSLGFNKKQEFKAFGYDYHNVSDFGEYYTIKFYDFLTANKMLEVIEQSVGENDVTPLFVYGFFEHTDQSEIKKHLEELKAMNRQVFIVENKDNYYLEKYCDKKIILEDKNND